MALLADLPNLDPELFQAPSSLSDLRLMDELRRGFFTPPCVGVGVGVGAVVWLLTCPSASARRF